jgi:hypothetical protein
MIYTSRWNLGHESMQPQKQAGLHHRNSCSVHLPSLTSGKYYEDTSI